MYFKQTDTGSPVTKKMYANILFHLFTVSSVAVLIGCYFQRPFFSYSFAVMLMLLFSSSLIIETAFNTYSGKFFSAPFKISKLLFFHLLYFAAVFFASYFSISFFAKSIRGFSFSNTELLFFVTFFAAFESTIFLVQKLAGLSSEINKILSLSAVLADAKAQAELEVLKNQLDPHFVFNALNTLRGIIQENKNMAVTFTDSLANVYAYILKSKQKSLVPINEEIEFIQNYYNLLEVRYKDCVSLKISFTNFDFENTCLPPMSLQILMENCFKHNSFSEETPLRIHINLTKDSVSVQNNILPKEFAQPSIGSGLENLRNRFFLLLQKEIEIENKGDSFTVKLPLKVIFYEYSDS